MEMNTREKLEMVKDSSDVVLDDQLTTKEKMDILASNRRQDLRITNTYLFDKSLDAEIDAILEMIERRHELAKERGYYEDDTETA